ncbi:MAG: DUF86 domain-containing protein [Candidatus Hydrothermarchaeales archaeon]
MDRDRILTKLDLLDTYLEELRSIIPKSLEEYKSSLQTKRVCERLLHLLIEIVTDVVYLLVKMKKLGLPAGDESAVDKLSKDLSEKTVANLKSMKRMRNILVHHYEVIEDEKVFDVLENHLNDFDEFKEEALKIINH